MSKKKPRLHPSHSPLLKSWFLSPLKGKTPLRVRLLPRSFVWPVMYVMPRRQGVVATARVHDASVVALGAYTVSPIELAGQKEHGTRRVSTAQRRMVSTATRPAHSSKSNKIENQNRSRQRLATFLIEVVATAQRVAIHCPKPRLRCHPSQVHHSRQH